MSLIDFAKTDRQREVVEAYEELGSQRKVGKALGLGKSVVQRHLAAVRRYAALRGYSPEHDMHRPAPDTHVVKGTSTLYDAVGAQRLQWVKTNLNHERYLVACKEAADALREDIPPSRPVEDEARWHVEEDLASLYLITDYHLGAYAWAEETGADWDVDIAEELLVRWFSKAIQAAPASEVAILGQLGDFLHWDGLDAVTPTAKNILDADTRFRLVVRLAIRVLRRVIQMLLENHPKVHVIMAEGNHDMAGSVWLSETFHEFYREEPRVTVDLRADSYHHFGWGETSLFFHHGHKRKGGKIDAVFAAKFREEFGKTKYSYAHTGHLHQAELVETPLMKIEQHRTLAAPDSFAARSGYSSGRDAQVITYSKKYGEVERSTLSPMAVSE